MTPHTCPVCNGEGVVYDPNNTGTSAKTKTCPACRGSCIVWEPDPVITVSVPDFYPEYHQVPSEVHKCPYCAGMGVVPFIGCTGHKICDHCHGTGYV